MGIDKQKEIKSISPGEVNWALQEFLSEIRQLSGSPRGVLALWACYVELMVNTVIKAKCKRGIYLTEKKRVPLQGKMDLLYELGAIDTTLYDDITLLRDQRNKAAHKFDWNFDYTIIERLKYLKKATNKTALDETKASQTPWVKVCFYLLSELGEHIKKMPPKRK